MFWKFVTSDNFRGGGVQRRLSACSPGFIWTTATITSRPTYDVTAKTPRHPLSTSGCSANACSTSSANIFSPPEFMVNDSRPWYSITPSARHLTRSPLMTWRTPSITGNVRWVFSLSLEISKRTTTASRQPTDGVIPWRQSGFRSSAITKVSALGTMPLFAESADLLTDIACGPVSIGPNHRRSERVENAPEVDV